MHLWVIRKKGGKPDLLFQRRAKHKDTYPGYLDITVGGHVPYGKKSSKIQKESHEEIGISPDDGDLTDLGYYRYEEKAGGLFHREFQRVYLYVDNRQLCEYSFNDGEVDGIYAVPLRDIENLLRKDIDISAEGYDGKNTSIVNISRKDFHPLLFSPTMEEYMRVVISGIKELTYGGPVQIKMPPPV